MREVYIFDIDGCVMPPIFSNFNNHGTRDRIVKEAVNNGKGIKLFPNFIKYYKKYCVKAESIFFITGRKKSEFGDLTAKQLHPLVKIKPFKVIYYLESKPHKLQKYFNWKVKTVKEIMKETIKRINSDINDTKSFIFHIFDDMNGYFSKITKFGDIDSIEIHLNLIENEESWSRLI